MSHQCSCGRDLNNNYVSYTNAYANANSGLDRDTNSTMSGKGSGASSAATSTQLTAKVMFDLMPFWLPLLWSLNLSLKVIHGEHLTAEKLQSDNTSENRTKSEIPKPFLTYEREARQLSENEEYKEDHSLRPSLMDIALQISARQGLDAMTELYTKIEPDMIKKGHLLDDNHPAALLSKFSAPAVDRSKPNPDMAAYAVISATKAFRKNYKYINDLARQAHSPKISLRRTALENLCPPREAPTCMPASHRYRTHDGTCNNERRPRWGSAQMPFNRFLPPVYGDGVDSIRNSVEGGSLSSSRFVSLLVHGARDGEAPLTLMIAQWGQLLDHDMTSTAQPRSINGSVPSCCGGNDFHPSCFPIKVPLDDPWLAPLKVRCLEFLRSAPAQRRDCILSWREQTNQATSYIDASPIYSNNAKSSDNARVFRNGLLIYGRGNPADDVCQRGAIANKCIRSGDGRSGEQPGLLAMHHVWVGEHNHIAKELSEMNQHWSDEKIYQETRRIVGAMFQHITYREFLPLVLGKEVCKLFELDLLSTGYYEGYDHKVNPTVANSFAAAAFRFGHSLVQNSYMRCDHHHNVISNNISLHEEFQRGDIGSAGSLHRLLRGMATQRALRRDEFITPELTNHLFQTAGFPFGLDLAAINIQRGRDHGIPAYTSWRIPCGLSQVNNWDDFAKVVGPESADRIRHAYRSVHDIDLFVGGIAERPVIGGLVGPTFACIIAQQFSNSRKGDRFWYENGNFESSFTPAQLHALRRVSLTQVLCRTVDGGTFQPHIFIPPGFEGNQRMPCGEGPLAPIDLSAWQEQDPFSGPIAAPPRVPQQNFETQNPDRIFDIVSSVESPSPPMTVHVIKEEKPGFPNRARPIEHKASALSINLPQVDLIPNASTGLHIPKNLTRINDKLDIRRKGTTIRRPIQTQVITGVNNKLDKNSRITLNIKGINRHRIDSTTRRTVIVNNVPIELRTAEDTTVTKTTEDNVTNKPRTGTQTTRTSKTTVKPLTSKRPKQKKRKSRPKTEKTHKARLEHNNEDVLLGPETFGDILVFHNDEIDSTDNATVMDTDFFDLTEAPIVDDIEKRLNTDSTVQYNTEEQTLKEDNEQSIIQTDYSENDIDPLKRTETLHDNKRIQREKVEEKDLTTTRTSRATENITKIQPLTTILTTGTPLQNSTVKINPITNLTVSKLFSLYRNISTLISTTTIRPRKRKTTPASVELRQYQTQQTYAKPHKVIVKGPNSDQYEIEINIRQTSSAIPLQPITSDYAEYTSTNVYNPYGTTYDRYTPNYMNSFSSTPSYSYYQQPVTAPTPYIQGQRTRPPTVIYLNENDRNELTTRQPSVFQNFLNYAANGLKPQSPVSGVLSNQKERPTNYFPSSVHSSSQVGNQYGLAAQSNYPVGSLSQTGGLHASSSAVSTGNFGSIVGVASANGADSAFSFNIRPKPNAATGYRPIPPKKPNFGQLTAPEYLNRPISTSSPDSDFVSQYQEQLNSPFSTQKRPNLPGYYSRTHQTDNTEFLHENIDRDYDYSSRMLEPLSNVSSTLNKHDYEYADDYDNDENIASAKKYDRDGYLRPEHMIENLFRTSDTTNRNKNSSLDDNYVLPVLNETTTAFFEFPKPMSPLTNLLLNLSLGITELPDTNAKNFKNDIQAENDYIDETTEPLIASKTAALIANQKSVPSIAFAPITILTKPERPDNWVFYDTPENKPLLPDPPEILADPAHISEIPKPFNDQRVSWLKKNKQKALWTQDNDHIELLNTSSPSDQSTTQES